MIEYLVTCWGHSLPGAHAVPGRPKSRDYRWLVIEYQIANCAGAAAGNAAAYTATASTAAALTSASFIGAAYPLCGPPRCRTIAQVSRSVPEAAVLAPLIAIGAPANLRIDRRILISAHALSKGAPT